MRNFKLLVFCLGLFITALQSNAKAGVNHREEKLTFSQPVEIPGRVLEPGTYDFSYLDPVLMPGIVVIYDSQGNTLKEVMTIPVYRNEVTDRTIVTFEKLAPNAPEAIKDWFFPGDDCGAEFIYPHQHS